MNSKTKFTYSANLKKNVMFFVDLGPIITLRIVYNGNCTLRKHKRSERKILTYIRLI